MDLKANIVTPITIKPMERVMVRTGLYIALPEGYEAQIRPRSGLAFKKGISIPNAPGTIDADYRGEIGVALINLSKENFTINDGDRIAQMIVAPYSKVVWECVTSLDDTDRSSGGFGSTGV